MVLKDLDFQYQYSINKQIYKKNNLIYNNNNNKKKQMIKKLNFKNYSRYKNKIN